MEPIIVVIAAVMGFVWGVLFGMAFQESLEE